MSIKEKINEDLKTSMKSGDKTRLNTVRSIRAAILEFEKSGANKELTPDDELKIINSAVKRRKESIEQFTAGGRPELALQEQAELNILMEYMPKQLSENEIIEIIKSIGENIGVKSKEDFPKLMPAVMRELKGKADGKLVKALVEKFLGII